MIEQQQPTMLAMTTAWSLVRRCALGIAAAMLLLGTQAVASASCGDYVFVRNAEGRLVRAGELMAGNRMATDHASLPPASPCHGPRCSRLPTAPPAAPPTTMRWQSVPEGLFSLLDNSASPRDVGRWPSCDGPARAIHHPGQIFRPPRS